MLPFNDLPVDSMFFRSLIWQILLVVMSVRS